MADSSGTLPEAKARNRVNPPAVSSNTNSAIPLQSRNPFRNLVKKTASPSVRDKRSSAIFDQRPGDLPVDSLAASQEFATIHAEISQSTRVFQTGNDVNDQRPGPTQQKDLGIERYDTTTNGPPELRSDGGGAGAPPSPITHRSRGFTSIAVETDRIVQRPDIELPRHSLLNEQDDNGLSQAHYTASPGLLAQVGSRTPSEAFREDHLRDDTRHSQVEQSDSARSNRVGQSRVPSSLHDLKPGSGQGVDVALSVPPNDVHHQKLEQSRQNPTLPLVQDKPQSPGLQQSEKARPSQEGRKAKVLMTVESLRQKFEDNNERAGTKKGLESTEQPSQPRSKFMDRQERAANGAKSSPQTPETEAEIAAASTKPHINKVGADHPTLSAKANIERRTDPAQQKALPVLPIHDEEEEVSESPEQLPDFDLASLGISDDTRLDPKVAQFLEKATQMYFSQHPMFTSTGTPQTSAETLSSKGKKPSENDDEDNEDDEFDDENFCCPEAQQLSSKGSADVFYCYACKLTFCSKDWDQERAHRRNKAGHDKVDAAVARMIEDTLGPRTDESEQARLHLLDESASWFGAIHEDDGVVFRDFGRYASLMAEVSLEHRKRAHPALISFVGDTGAGKSSIIKLLVGTKSSKTIPDKSPAKQVRQTPVVGNNGATTPTSGDVHLYADPETFLSDRPILYADCEGLRGGTLEPVGARLRRKMHDHARNRNRTASFDRHVRRRHETAEREVEWATTPEKKTRKYFVEHLYPRLLYTFSDVIVFVVKNARMIEDVMEQLIIWADAVIESANNQPVLPHAIIVLNASDNSDSRLWNVDTSTAALLGALSQAVDHNPRLKSFATKWSSRGFSISSMQSLLLAYYSSIRVIRIPEKKSPSLIHDQIKQLYQEINDTVTQAHDEKHQKRLKLNAEALQPYLQQAFDHFCHNLNDPFDFIKASFADTGIPTDFCGNTLKLAVDIMHHWSNRIDDTLLFKELSFIVASCVMLDAVRNRNLGEATGLFKEYINHFDETVDDFYEKVWPCEFVNEKGRCINVRVGHVKGHQLGRGQVVAGEYQSTSSIDSLRELYRKYIFGNLAELLSRLTGAPNEQETAAHIHQTLILGPFYSHNGGAHHYVSHSTCLSCLVAPAEHCLPCGHVLCTPCIRDFGNRRSQDLFEIRHCPLHKSSSSSWKRTIVLKPERAGTRILSLDGGGVRGILMLMTLERLEQDLGGIPVQAFFDLIIGTSTGGIIALGLVEMGWSVAKCLQKFWDLADKAFQKHRNLGSLFTEYVISGYQGGRYKTEPLEEVLSTHYEEYQLFGGVRYGHAESTLPCKVAVTTTSTGGTPFLLANYNRLEKDDSARYTFLRAEKPTKGIRIWEAARCTSAAPRIFKPYTHTDSGHTFIDGGIYYNNPIEIALRENALIWPLERPRLPDIMLSLGTGFSNKKRGLVAPPVQSSRTPLGQLAQHYKQLIKIATDHVKSSLRSEDEYRRVREHYEDNQQTRNCFKRFNYHFPSEFGKLDTDSVERMPYLENFAKVDLDSRRREIRDLADRLIATCFYFDVEEGSIEKTLGGTITLQGHIRCRFPPTSSEMKMFGDLLRSRIQETETAGGNVRHSPCFVIQDKSRPVDASQVLLEDYTINLMQDHGQFALGKIKLVVANYHAESDIYLRFGGEPDNAEHNSISGFPRCWDDRRLTPMTSRLNLSDIRARQASRRGRPAWVGPEVSPARMLAKYANALNPGLAADDELIAVQSRLSKASVAVREPTTVSNNRSIDHFANEKSSGSKWLSSSSTTEPPEYIARTEPDGRDGVPAELMDTEFEDRLPLPPRQLDGLHELG